MFCTIALQTSALSSCKIHEGQLAANQFFEKIFIGNSSHYIIEETLAFVESLENKTDQEIREEIVAFANTHQ